MKQWFCALVLGWCMALPDAHATPTPQIDPGLVAGLRGATDALLRHEFEAFPLHELAGDGAGGPATWVGTGRGCESGPCFDHIAAGIDSGAVEAADSGAVEAAMAIAAEDADAYEGKAPPAAPAIGAARGIGASPAMGTVPAVGATPTIGAVPARGPVRETGAIPVTGAASGSTARYSRQLQSVVVLSVPAFLALIFLGAVGAALWSRRRY